jgi:glutamate carboxypeptidase
MTPMGAFAPIVSGAVDVLLDYCGISSPSGDRSGLEAMGRRLGDDLEPLGLHSELIDEVDPDGNRLPVLVARGSDTERDPILLIGHLDTVLPAVEPHIDGDRLRGTGALDMKGGFAALVGALRLAHEQGVPLPNNLMLVAVPDEEVGGPISEATVRRWGAEAGTVLVLEPGERRGEAETLVTGRRGLSGWRLEARGRASHSGLAYWDGRSALTAAAEWATRAQALSVRGSGVLVNVGRIVGGDAELVDDLEEHHSLVGTNRRLNIVPDRCVAEGEVRFFSWDQRERTLETLRGFSREISDRTGVSLDLDVFETIPPFDPNGPGAVLAERAVASASRFGWRLELEPDRGGVSFPNLLPDPSRLPVLDGIGPVGDGMHTRDEFLCLRSLERRIGLLADLLTSLA